MKNPTILKDELSLLRADKSAVITELRNKGKELEGIYEEISDLESKRKEVRDLLIEETARLDDIRSRAISIKAELIILTQDLNNKQNSIDILKHKNSQEVRNHLGRIKELENEISDSTGEISKLKTLFDNNSRVYSAQDSDKNSRLRLLDSEISAKEKQIEVTDKELQKKTEEEKKMTRERLKREDKLRLREKILDGKEASVSKREEDLITMSKDMTIVYGRMKEIYAKISPDVDLDKIILQAI